MLGCLLLYLYSVDYVSLMYWYINYESSKNNSLIMAK